jgi:hypothetical protein
VHILLYERLIIKIDLIVNNINMVFVLWRSNYEIYYCVKVFFVKDAVFLPHQVRAFPSYKFFFVPIRNEVYAECKWGILIV